MGRICNLAGVLGIVIALGFSNVRSSAQSAPPSQRHDTDAKEALRRAPKFEISNGLIRAVVLKPDPHAGFYRASRFDWSGVVASLVYRNQEYYGLWFDEIAPDVRDFVWQDGKLVAGPNTAVLGPAEAFDPENPPGFKTAAAGQAFLKIGVGLLKKPDGEAPYSAFRSYELLDGGRWSTEAKADRVTSVQTLANSATGWGYIYTKTVRLGAATPQMIIEHSLTNIGSKTIATSTFNHNFLTLGEAPTRLGLTLQTPFVVKASQPVRSDALRFEEHRLTVSRPLADGETAQARVVGFSTQTSDHQFRLTNASGAGYSVTADRPLTSFVFWSISRTASAEPYIELTAEPGATVHWSTTYTYFAPDAQR